MCPKTIADAFREDFGFDFHNNANTEYNCPACEKTEINSKLDNPSLCLFKTYPCYRCKRAINIGIWPAPEYSEDNPKIYWGHETALHPELVRIYKHHGIILSFEYSSEAGFSYWRQICPHCKASQGDFYIRNYYNQVKSDPNQYEIHSSNLLYCRRCFRTFIKYDVEQKCFRCNRPISENVRKFCLNRQDTFKGYVYCLDCQKLINSNMPNY